MWSTINLRQLCVTWGTINHFIGEAIFNKFASRRYYKWLFGELFAETWERRQYTWSIVYDLYSLLLIHPFHWIYGLLFGRILSEILILIPAVHHRIPTDFALPFTNRFFSVDYNGLTNMYLYVNVDCRCASNGTYAGLIGQYAGSTGRDAWPHLSQVQLFYFELLFKSNRKSLLLSLSI